MKMLEVLTAAAGFHAAVQILEAIKVAPAERQVLIAGALDLPGGVKQQHRQPLLERLRLRSGVKTRSPGYPWPEGGSGSAKDPARPPDSAENTAAGHGSSTFSLMAAAAWPALTAMG